MFHRYGEFIARRAKFMLVLSGVALVVALALGFGAFGKLKNGGFDDPSAESSRAIEIMDAKYGGRVNLLLLVHSKVGTVDSPQARAAGEELTSALAKEPTVTNVVSYWSTSAPSLKSRDGNEALVLGHITGNDTEIADRADTLIERYTGDRTALTIQAGGDAAANRDVTSEVVKSLAVAEAIAVPLTLLLLVLAFGSLVAASLPLAIGGLAILGTFAELFLLGSVTDVSVFAINLTTALGMGLGIDYGLLLVARFREQLGQGQSVPDAVVRTVETAGRTIVFSAATVVTALAALLVFPLFFLRSFAYAGIGVVAIAAVAALVVVPALLAVLGPRVNAGRLPWSQTVRSGSSRMWSRIAAVVIRRPALAALPVVAALLLAASPLLGVSFGTPDAGVLPTSAASRQVADTLRTDFAGNDAAAVDVIVTGPVAAGPLASYAQQLSRLPGVLRVYSSAGTFAAGKLDPVTPFAGSMEGPDVQRLAVVTTLEPKSTQSRDLVRAIRDVPGPGASTLVGGDDAQLADTKHAIGSRLPLAAALIVVSTFVLLFLFTGSVVQPLRALVLNALSLAATVGVMTWIFQDGHLASVLGFTPRPMDTSMTVLLFCIAFGLSMDYEVFLTSRIKELHDTGADTTDAVVQGLGSTGRIVSTAAGLIAVSFFAFATSSVSFLQMFGLGSGLAILIDATLVRGILVPAAMRLLGRLNWYSPPALRRIHRRVALAET